MSERRIDQLLEELRRWAERPASLSPRQARRRVLARLPERRRRPVWRLAVSGAALAAAALAIALLVERPGAPVAEPAAATGRRQTIVHQLSSGTKLYIVLRAEDERDDC